MFLCPPHSRPAQPLLVAALVVALLVTQGLRLCFDPVDAGSGASGHTSLHLESNMMAPGVAEESHEDQHFDLDYSLVKQAALAFALLVGFAILFIILPLSPGGYARAERDTRPLAVRLRSLRPPLRAPPR